MGGEPGKFHLYLQRFRPFWGSWAGWLVKHFDAWYRGADCRFRDELRVMGKKVEEALLGYTVERAKAAGADHILAPPVDGPRNQPAKSFFAEKFVSVDSASIDMARVSIPSHISMKEEV